MLLTQEIWLQFLSWWGELLSRFEIKPSVEKLRSFCQTTQIGCFPKKRISILVNQPTVHSGGDASGTPWGSATNGATSSSFIIFHQLTNLSCYYLCGLYEMVQLSKTDNSSYGKTSMTNFSVFRTSAVYNQQTWIYSNVHYSSMYTSRQCHVHYKAV